MTCPGFDAHVNKKDKTKIRPSKKYPRKVERSWKFRDPGLAGLKRENVQKGQNVQKGRNVQNLLVTCEASESFQSNPIHSNSNYVLVWGSEQSYRVLHQNDYETV